MDPRTELDIMENRKIFLPDRKSNVDSSVVEPVG
jgi:hypothetical protein